MAGISQPAFWVCALDFVPKLENLSGVSTRAVVIDLNNSENSQWHQLMSSSNPETFIPPSPFNVQHDLAVMPFSSGTTGPPKGVLLSHLNIVSALFQAK